MKLGDVFTVIYWTADAPRGVPGRVVIEYTLTGFRRDSNNQDVPQYRMRVLETSVPVNQPLEHK